MTPFHDVLFRKWKDSLKMTKNRRNILVGVVLAVVGIVGVLLVVIVQRLQSDPIPLGDPSNTLAFISDRDGNWDIFLLDPDGNLTNLTAEGDFEDYFVSWAFDGEMINFLTNRGGAEELGPGQVAADGSDLRALGVAEAISTVIFEGRIDWDPIWSPDGQQIAWSSLRDFNLELYTGDADGQNFTRITESPARDWFPKISPDGTQVLFSSDRDGKENVYLVDFDGGEITQLTDSEWDDLQPMWSMDSDSILYISDVEDALLDGEITLYLMDMDGGNKRPFNADDDVWRGDLVYSADGSQVAYMSNEEGNWHIYMMDADGENVVRLTEGEANHMFPVWRPVPAETEAE